MKRAAALAVALAPLAANALLGTSFKVGVRDEATGKPLEGAIVIAREFATVGKFHGTDTYCVRADAAVISGPGLTMDLPFAGSDVTTMSKGLEAIAYHPGYCLSATERAARISDYKHYPHGYDRPKEIDTWGETRLALRRAGADPEERLLYLQQVIPAFVCPANRWSARSDAALKTFREAIVGEARALARTRYENALAKVLADSVPAASVTATSQQHFDAVALGGRTHPGAFTPDFLVGPSNMRVTWGANTADVIGLAITTQQGRAASHAIAPQGAIAGNAMRSAPILVAPSPPEPEPTRLVIHCRHGEPSKCDLNERNGSGETALYGYARAGKIAEVKVLLDAGADPSIPLRPDGPLPLDAAINRVIGYQQADRAVAAEIVDLLAAHPRATITQKLKDDFAADPATWTQVVNNDARALLAARRAALAKLPVRVERKPACESPGYASVYSGRDLPARLRSQP